MINSENLKLPNHIGFIMDGNGRWAKKRLLPRNAGHRQGVKAMQKVIDLANEYGIKAVSFYAFSTENWSRPQSEINALFGMIKTFATKELPKYSAKNFVIKYMGDLTKLPQDIQDTLYNSIEETKNNTGTIVNIGINYGGQDEIVYAVKELIASGKDITKENLEKHLYTANLPSLDLIVRSSGEERLSNFMLWQSAYSELIFRKEFWPDFDREIFENILLEYNNRNRRFGKV